MNQLKTAYLVLGLHPGSNLYSVYKRYRQLARIWHPDRYEKKARTEAETRMKLINGMRDLIRQHYAAAGHRPFESCPCLQQQESAAAVNARQFKDPVTAGNPNAYRKASVVPPSNPPHATPQKDNAQSIGAVVSAPTSMCGSSSANGARHSCIVPAREPAVASVVHLQGAHEDHRLLMRVLDPRNVWLWVTVMLIFYATFHGGGHGV